MLTSRPRSGKSRCGGMPAALPYHSVATTATATAGHLPHARYLLPLCLPAASG